MMSHSKFCWLPLVCWLGVSLLPLMAAERWVSTLSGDYLMLDSRCSSYEIDELSGLRIGVLQQESVDTQLSPPNLMIALGGGGHTREAYEDLAARVFERLFPDCVESGRAAPHSVIPQRLPNAAPRPDLTPHPCGVRSMRPWVVVGAAAAPGQSFATAEGCMYLVQLARSVQARWNTTRSVHLSGVSAGGIAALECLVQHNEVFASATVFAGFLESADLDGDQGQRFQAKATVALRDKPVRIYVGDDDRLFRELAEEQFGHGGTVMSSSGCSDDVVRVLLGVGHELLSELDLSDLCAWMSGLDGVD